MPTDSGVTHFGEYIWIDSDEGVFSDDEGGIDFNEDELYSYQEEFENTENFTCHQDYKTHTSIVVGLKFWLEGVTLSITGAFGLFGNLITLKVLRKQVSLFPL